MTRVITVDISLGYFRLKYSIFFKFSNLAQATDMLRTLLRGLPRPTRFAPIPRLALPLATGIGITAGTYIYSYASAEAKVGGGTANRVLGGTTGEHRVGLCCWPIEGAKQKGDPRWV